MLGLELAQLVEVAREGLVVGVGYAVHGAGRVQRADVVGPGVGLAGHVAGEAPGVGADVAERVVDVGELGRRAARLQVLDLEVAPVDAPLGEVTDALVGGCGTVVVVPAVRAVARGGVGGGGEGGCQREGAGGNGQSGQGSSTHEARSCVRVRRHVLRGAWPCCVERKLLVWTKWGQEVGALERPEKLWRPRVGYVRARRESSLRVKLWPVLAVRNRPLRGCCGLSTSWGVACDFR